MTPEAFIARWKDNRLTERAGAQAHFDDLCDLLGVAKPRDPDNYCFERGAKKAGGGDGWADVWKRGHFGWENKKPGRDLNAALTAGEGINLTKISSLVENLNIAFKGAEKSGAFELPGDIARCWLTLPNPNGRPNSDIVKPWANGQDIAKRPSDTWIVDFGVDMSVADASLYEKPFEHVLLNVKAEREKNNDRGRRENWWRFGRNGADMRPDSRLCVISRADDTTFGLLSSRQHLVWALANASMHGVGNDPTYNNASCFETFPFPPSLTPRDTAPVAGQASPPCLAGRIVAEAIAAARRLNELREAWLNPAEWVDWVITPEEERAGFPQRPVAKPGFDADLKKRTLTNLYNTRPAWLDLAHKALDQAVAVAYGWPDYTPEMPDEEILRRLLALNLERSQP